MGWGGWANPTNWSVGGNSVGSAFTNLAEAPLQMSVGQKPFSGQGVSKFRNLGETGAVLAGNYFLPGSSLLTSRLASRGSQYQLGTPLGIAGQLVTGAAGTGVGSDYTGIPASAGGQWEAGMLGYGSGTGDGSQYFGPGSMGGNMGGADPALGGYGGMGTDPSKWDYLMSQGGLPLGGGGAATGGAAASGGMGNYFGNYLKFAGAANIAGGLYGLSQSHGAGRMQQQQANQYAQQLQALEANPQSVQNLPGYAGGMQAVRGTDASTGYGHSGKEQLDIFNYANQAYTNQVSSLSNMEAQSQALANQNTATTTGAIGGIGSGLAMFGAGGGFSDVAGWF